MEDRATESTARDTSVGHLSVHLESEHPQEVSFLFEQPQKRLPGAFGFALLVHLTVPALFLVAVSLAPVPQPVEDVFAKSLNDKIIWVAEEGPGGGGGGGGNQMKEPPRKVELPGQDKITVPVMKPKPVELQPEQKPKDEPKPEQMLNIPARTLADATEILPGALDGSVLTTLSRGPGIGGGAGTGNGTGIGPGTGSGLGPGSGGGTGGGVYRPGSGVTLPVKLREVKPQYTADAMRAKVQGTVMLECVVQPDGSVTDVQVIRSLDPVFGLDQEAIKAARQWRFIPGTKGGQPVPVLISIEMEFTLR